MRIRYIKPSFFLNENLAELSFEFRLIYTGVWCCADREGRVENRPRRLKAEIMPYDNVDMEKAINVLCSGGFLTKYENTEKEYLQVEKWEIHQRIHHTEKDSIIPSYNDNNSIILLGKGNLKGKGKGKGKAGKGKQETPHGEEHVKDTLIILFEEIQSKFTEQQLLLKEGFLDYWAEKSKGGHRERWETEKTFDVIKRFHRWLNNDEKFGKFNSSNKPHPKAIKGKYADQVDEVIGE